MIKIGYGNYIQTKATESCNNGVFSEMEARRTHSFWDYIPTKADSSIYYFLLACHKLLWKYINELWE
jgi:hypothetical protein